MGGGGGGGSEDEHDLVERYRRGDGAAMEALLARFDEDLKRAAERGLPRNLRQRVSVSDVLQETRLTAFERRADFSWRGAGSFRRWVIGIAGNKVMQAVRHHLGTGKRSTKREAVGPHRPRTTGIPSREPSPSQIAVASELEALARKALSSLPQEQRDVLRLAREEGLGMEEIANRLGIPPGIAKRLYGKAVVRFREAFDGLRGSGHG